MAERDTSLTPEEQEIKRKSRIRIFFLLVGVSLLLVGCLVYSIIEMVANFR